MHIYCKGALQSAVTPLFESALKGALENSAKRSQAYLG